MSSKRGECQRKRPQRHQNSTVFKNDLHDSSDRTKKLNAMSINEVCQKCRDVIEWKIKYRKYKALSQPKACTRCNQREVKKAYHVLCRNCAIELKQCAKCMKSATDVEIIPAGPTEKERLLMDIEMKQLISALPERKRRTFMRFMKGKKKKIVKEAGDDEEEPEEEPAHRPTRDELLRKIAYLKTGIKVDGDENEDEDEGDDEDDWSTDNCSDGDD